MKTYYYTDELNDDFAGTNIKRKPLKENYRYIKRNPLWRLTSCLLYRLIATPIVFLIEKLVYREKIVDRKKLRPYRKSGYFLYGNHTTAMSDAFTPTLVAFPKKAHILVNPDTVSLPVLSPIVEMLGGMPVPDSLAATRKFTKAIDERAQKGQVIVVYPEAHIWPYHTKIRPFKDSSFKYPAAHGKPVFTFTKTFQKRRFGKTPKITVYIDGPFLPEPTFSVPENKKALRNAAYEAMVARSKYSTYEINRFIKQPTPDEG